MTGTATDTPTDTTTLTAGDRCDRCGAQAYVRAVLPGGADLVFCLHHGREYTPTLRARSAEVVDESARLLN